jgi:hypothetical protein
MDDIAAELDSLRAALGGKGPMRPYSREAIQAAIPSPLTIVAVALASAAVGALCHGALRGRLVAGKQVLHERWERHTADSLEIYERFEQSTILVHS